MILAGRKHLFDIGNERPHRINDPQHVLIAHVGNTL
jgi:hypothetical protein